MESSLRRCQGAGHHEAGGSREEGGGEADSSWQGGGEEVQFQGCDLAQLQPPLAQQPPNQCVLFLRPFSSPYTLD